MNAGKGKILRTIIYVLLVVTLWSCDNWGSFDFKMKNATSHRLELRFKHKVSEYIHDSIQHDTIVLLPGEEKLVRIIPGTLNTPSHDCMKLHGLNYLTGIEFDTYVDSVKLDKLLYNPDNWVYYRKSKWDVEYDMIVTDELLSAP